MPDPLEHAENRGWIESILQYIPGFGGYLRLENRREADELQREWLADRLQRSKRGLDDYALALTNAGQLAALADVERLRVKLDTLIARIRGAMQGYSGFFDLVTVDEAALDRVYEHEVKLMEQIDELASGVGSLGTGDAAADTAIAALFAKVANIDSAWDQREDMLKGLH